MHLTISSVSDPRHPESPDSQTSPKGLIPRKWPARVKWISAILMVISLSVVARQLPVERGIAVLSDWIQSFGWSGYFVYAGIYAILTVLFVPGTPLTVAAGSLFGLFAGTATVSLGSILGAAACFLIARSFGRDAILQRVRRKPKFEAVDRAIGVQGWKIVALLRLSPVFPFNLSNYMFGLTAVRFWPYVISSWLAMLPGTFMLVYIGFVVKAGLTKSDERGTGQWAMLIVGLLATVMVTIYITRLARRSVGGYTEHGGIPATNGTASHLEEARSGTDSLWGTSVIAILAALSIACAAFTIVKRDAISGLFGPPQVELAEAFGEKTEGLAFDHSVFDQLLNKYVNAQGRVDYKGLQKDAEKLDAYIASLEKAPFQELGRDEKLSFLINAYNACTLRLILDHLPVKSIKDIPSAKRWDDVRWKIAGQTLSLNQIEHQQIRPKFKEPRIHFALVCAAKGCPPLRSEAFAGAKLEKQLDSQAKYIHAHETWFQLDLQTGSVKLTSLYKWYGDDFEQVFGSVLKFAAAHSPELKTALDAGKEVKVSFLSYDWSLNAQE